MTDRLNKSDVVLKPGESVVIIKGDWNRPDTVYKNSTSYEIKIKTL